MSLIVNAPRVILSLAFIVVLGAILLGVALLDDATDGAYYTRDTTAVGDLPPWAGAFSTLGLMLWGVAAGACALAGIAARRLGILQWRFLLSTAALMALLGLDDAFQLHETIGPEYLHLTEALVYMLIGGLALVWLLYFRGDVLGSDTVLFALAITCLMASLGVDVTHKVAVVIEDWLKYSGLGLLMAWCFSISLAALRVPGEREGRPLGSLREEVLE